MMVVLGVNSEHVFRDLTGIKVTFTGKSFCNMAGKGAYPRGVVPIGVLQNPEICVQFGFERIEAMQIRVSIAKPAMQFSDTNAMLDSLNKGKQRIYLATGPGTWEVFGQP